MQLGAFRRPWVRVGTTSRARGRASHGWFSTRVEMLVRNQRLGHGKVRRPCCGLKYTYPFLSRGRGLMPKDVALRCPVDKLPPAPSRTCTHVVLGRSGGFSRDAKPTVLWISMFMFPFGPVDSTDTTTAAAAAAAAATAATTTTTSFCCSSCCARVSLRKSSIRAMSRRLSSSCAPPFPFPLPTPTVKGPTNARRHHQARS